MDAEQPRMPAANWVPTLLFGTNVLFSRIFYAQIGVAYVPYLFCWFVGALLSCWMAEWRRNVAWVHVYACLVAQAVCDAAQILMPRGFVLYAAIPLMLVGGLEVAVTAVVRDHAYRTYAQQAESGTWRQTRARYDHPWHIRVVYAIYNDKDVRQWYAVIFEVYMTLCSCVLALRGSFMRAPCLASAYAGVVGLLFVAADELRDLRTISPTDTPLPSPAVKAVYALYAPAQFLQPLLALSVVTLVCGGADHDRTVNLTIAGGVALAMLLAAVFQRNIDSCPIYGED